MKTKTNSVLVVFLALLSVCILIVPLLSCSFFGIPDYKLTVTVKDGIQGTPESGQYPYKDLTVVDYKYSPVNSLHTVEVILDGGQQPAEGKVTMYNNFALEARLIDIRGIWNITFSYKDATIPAIKFKITISGSDILSGTFSDDRGYSGTWDASNGNLVLKYTNWKGYTLTGSLFSVDFNLNGTWSNGDVTGTWSAARK